MGTLGDRIGRRRLLMIGAAAFGVASALAAFSTSAEMLIGARALLGIAVATLALSTLALIRNIATAVYRGQLDDAVGAGVSPGAAEAARDTLGGAQGVSEQLPAAVLEAAGQAFTQGLQVIAVISVVALAGMALLAAIVLRDVEAGSEAELRPEDEPSDPVVPPANAERVLQPAHKGCSTP